LIIGCFAEARAAASKKSKKHYEYYDQEANKVRPVPKTKAECQALEKKTEAKYGMPSVIWENGECQSACPEGECG
jgi:hypothetical protein